MTQAQREQRAAKIRMNPELYLVCCGCGSILSRNQLDARPQRTCPICAHFRFDETVNDVLKGVEAALASQHVPTYD
jgi:rubrerythrin